MIIQGFGRRLPAEGLPGSAIEGSSDGVEVIGLYKTEVIWPNAPWPNIEEVEFATLEWVDWFNNRRLLGPIGNIPPAEFEALYSERQESPTMGVGLT